MKTAPIRLIVVTCISSVLLTAARGADEIIAGNITLNPPSGPVTIELKGPSDANPANTALGFTISYMDGATPSLIFRSEGTTGLWEWQDMGGELDQQNNPTDRLAMSLDASRMLTLYDPESAVTIELQPGTGGSGRGIRINGDPVLTASEAAAIYVRADEVQNVITVVNTLHIEHALAVGENAVASGSNSLAAGESASATQADTVALGHGASASVRQNIAIGAGATASGDNLWFMPQQSGHFGLPGNETEGWMYGSIAMGAESQATGAISTALGPYARAAGSSSVAIGPLAYTYGGDASQNLAEASGSVALGWSAFVMAPSGSALGALSRVGPDGVRSTALGTYTYAGARDSVCIGSYTMSFGQGQTVVGMANKWVGNYTSVTDPNGAVFVVGNGTGDAEAQRSNALTVRRNGDVHVQGRVLVEASGDLSMGEFTAGPEPRPNEPAPW